MRGLRGFLAFLPWVLAIVPVSPQPVRAHDLWLEPSVYFAPRGQEVDVKLTLGENGRPEEVKPVRRADLVACHLADSRHPTQDLLGKLPKDGTVPNFRFHMDGGNRLLTMERAPKRLELEGEKFTHYLTEEGHTEALARRAQVGEEGRPGRERYRRYLKTLVQEAEPAGAPAVLYRRRVGLRLEILLENDPGRMRPGQPVRVRVLFEHRPLSGVRVTALHRPRPDAPAARTLTATTDSAGRATFPPFDVEGPWLVRLVYLRPAPAGAGDDAEWESFWGAYTFGVRMRPSAPAVAAPSPALHRGG